MEEKDRAGTEMSVQHKAPATSLADVVDSYIEPEEVP